MARRTNKSTSGIYVAKDAFACEIDGQRYNVSKHERVREGHELLKTYSDYFEPLEDGRVHYDVVEQASAAPGELRGDR